MNARNKTFKLSALAVAVLAAVGSVPAYADDAEAAALKMPTSTVEIGVSNTSDNSAKFGEYNGLNKKGANLVGNIDIRGGDAYSNNEQGGTSRWSLIGTDLGLSNRSLSGSFSNQGAWNLGISYDELQHNLSDTYQTPYQGSMGGNRFTLPANFGLAANTQALSATQLGAYQGMGISSSRKNTSVTAGLALDSRWSLNFDFNHLEQSGAKLQAFGLAGFGGVTGEAVAILPMPTNYKTDTFNLGLNWTGDKAHFSTSYFGSFVRDGYDRVTFQTYAGASTLQNMSTMPGNNFHQLNFSGGYALSSRTKLAGNLSYGRNSQDSAYVVDGGLMITPAPRTSLNGLVVTTHADLKLTDQTTKDLVLSGALKYDERDNRSPSDIYNYTAISGSASHILNAPNAPVSNKKAQLLLTADYRLKKDHHLRLGYEHADVNRWCNQYAVNAGYPAGTNCVVATANKDDKLDATYRLKANEAVDVKFGLGYNDRKTTSDPNARWAFIGTNGGVAGQNAGDFVGFYPYFDASRRQQLAKVNVNWQASEQLSLGLGGKYTGEKYYDSTYGVQNGNTWSLNLDATYAVSETGSITTYVTKQHRQRDLTDQQRTTASAAAASATAIAVPAGASWTNKLTDDDVTVGLGFKNSGLMAGKLELAGDLTYSIGNAAYGTALNYNTTTTGGLTCSNAAILSCGQLPDIKTTLTQLKLSGTYALDKKSKVVLRLMHQRLSSSDYYYNGLLYGANPSTMLATNQAAPNYSINVIAVSYIYSF